MQVFPGLPDCPALAQALTSRAQHRYSSRQVFNRDQHSISVYGDHTHFCSVIVEGIALVRGRNFTIDLAFS